MKYCNHCGNPMGDQDKFCNKCGGRPEEAHLNQNPVYPQPGVQFSAAPVSTMPYKPAFWAIGLFIALGFVVVELIQGIVSTVMAATGTYVTPVLVSFLISAVYSVIFLGMVVIGFVIYNSNCTRNAHPEKKLNILFAAIPWLLRGVLDFIFGLLWSLLFQIIVNNPDMTEAVGMLSMAWSFVSAVIIALITCLVSILILKAVVKGK